MRSTVALLLAASLTACGKSQSTPSTDASSAAPPTTAPPTAAPPTAAAPAEAPVELEAKEGVIVTERGRIERVRVAYTLSVPKGWGPTGLQDGTDSVMAFGPPNGGEDGPGVVLSAAVCDDCTAEAFLALQTRSSKESKATVFRSELTAAGVAVHIYERKGRRELIASKTIAAPDKALAQCMASMAEPVAPALWDALVAACEGMKLGELRPVLDGDLLASEQGKLAGCPTATTVTYTGNKATPAFGEVKAAGAVQVAPGHLVLRIANAEKADLMSDALDPGVLRLEARLVAAPGQEVTSGAYGRAPQPPMAVELRLSGTTPPAADGEEEGRFGDENDWTGAESKVEVIARTRDRVCGRFHFKDARHEAKGDFDLKVEAPPR